MTIKYTTTLFRNSNDEGSEGLCNYSSASSRLIIATPPTH